MYYVDQRGRARRLVKNAVRFQPNRLQASKPCIEANSSKIRDFVFANRGIFFVFLPSTVLRKLKKKKTLLVLAKKIVFSSKSGRYEEVNEIRRVFRECLLIC